MYDYSGWIVRSTAGHDKGTLLCVVGVDQEERLLLVADGKTRGARTPKRKKLGHVAVLDRGTFGHPAVRSLLEHRQVSDSELRRALAMFRDELAANGQGR